MLSWVTDCERSNKPLQCPVCKSRIQLEGPWDPVVAITDVISNKFTRASPFILLSSTTMGVQFSLQLYGALSMWAFSGREALVDFVLGPEVWANGRTTRLIETAGTRLTNALVLTNVAPALLLGQLTPWVGNKIFVPSASLYGIYHVLHDDNFFSWPPSPQLAMAVFPYIRSAYLNLWREFVFPYEVNLNRQIMGLPPVEPRQQGQAADQQRPPNGEGGIVRFLNGLIDALEADDGEEHDHDHDHQAARQVRVVENEDQGVEGEMMLELVIEEVEDEDEGNDSDESEDELLGEEALDAAMDRLVQGQAVGQQPRDNGEQPPQDNNEEPQDDGEHPRDDHEVPDLIDIPAQDPPQVDHEAPQAPPARRPGLGSILSGVSNAIVTALILPGISFAMGELIRLALPKSWTSAPRSSLFMRGPTTRPGLFQQQWGRSLVGGCLFVVIKDVVRLYSKYRKVAAMGKRRVKNVDRQRG